MCAGQTPADLFGPHATPPALTKASAALDVAVVRCYIRNPFNADRLDYLPALDDTLTTPLAPIANPKRARRTR